MTYRPTYKEGSKTMAKISLNQVNKVMESAIAAFNKQKEASEKNQIVLDFSQQLEDNFSDGQFLPSVPISWLRNRNIRSFSTQTEEFEQLKLSIEREGIINLPTITTHKGYLYIVDGHRRISALKELGIPNVDCILKKGKTAEIETMQAMANLATEKMSLVELANTALRFEEELGMDQKEVGIRLKISDRKKVSKLLMLAKWPEEFKKIVEENPTKLKQTTLFKVIRSEMTPSEIEEALESLLNPSRKGASAKKQELVDSFNHYIESEGLSSEQAAILSKGLKDLGFIKFEIGY